MWSVSTRRVDQRLCVESRVADLKERGQSDLRRAGRARSRRFGRGRWRAVIRTCSWTPRCRRSADGGRVVNKAVGDRSVASMRPEAPGDPVQSMSASAEQPRRSATEILRGLIQRGLDLACSLPSATRTPASSRDREGPGLQLAALHRAFPQGLLRTRPQRSARAELGALIRADAVRRPSDLAAGACIGSRTAVAHLDRAPAEDRDDARGRRATTVLAFYAFPPSHWRKLRSTNPLERFNREVGRRTDVVGIFPDDHSLIRLAGMLCIEQNDEWLVGRGYLSAESIALCAHGPREVHTQGDQTGGGCSSISGLSCRGPHTDDHSAEPSYTTSRDLTRFLAVAGGAAASASPAVVGTWRRPDGIGRYGIGAGVRWR